MNLEEANKIVNTWGKYIELIHSKLTFIFFAAIPESLLPYTKDIIERAINMLVEDYDNKGDKNAAQTLQNTITYLSWYVEDGKALQEASENFKNEKFIEKAIPALKKFRDEHQNLI